MKEEYSKIISGCFKRLNISPLEVSLLYSLANAYYHLENYDEAKKYFQKIVYNYSGTLQAELATKQLKRIKETLTKDEQEKEVLKDKIMPIDVEDAILVIRQIEKQQEYVKKWLSYQKEIEEKVKGEEKKEKVEYFCQECGKGLTIIDTFFYNHIIVCVNCIDIKLQQDVDKELEVKKKFRPTKIPVIRGALAGIIASIIYSFFLTLLHLLGVGFAETLLGISFGGSKFFFILWGAYILNISPVGAIIGSLLEYYEKVDRYLVGAFYSFLIGFGILLLIQGVFLVEKIGYIFTIFTLFSASISYFILGLIIILVDKLFLKPPEERTWG